MYVHKEHYHVVELSVVHLFIRFILGLKNRWIIMSILPISIINNIYVKYFINGYRTRWKRWNLLTSTQEKYYFYQMWLIMK